MALLQYVGISYCPFNLVFCLLMQNRNVLNSCTSWKSFQHPCCKACNKASLLVPKQLSSYKDSGCMTYFSCFLVRQRYCLLLSTENSELLYSQSRFKHAKRRIKPIILTILIHMQILRAKDLRWKISFGYNYWDPYFSFLVNFKM